MTEASAFGVSVHSALAKWGRKEVDSGKMIVDSEQPSMFNEEQHSAFSIPAYRLPTGKAGPGRQHSASGLLEVWNESFVHNVYASKAAADFDRERGEVLMKEFYEWWGREDRKVIGIEKSFKIGLGSCRGGTVCRPREEKESSSVAITGRDDVASLQNDVVISGRFDRVEELIDGTLRIIDFKTTAPRSQEEVDTDMQLSIYALAAEESFKKEVKELVMLYMHEENITEVVTERSDSELKTASKNIQLLLERIGSGDYSPTPSKEKCGKCPYRRVCDASAL